MEKARRNIRRVIFAIAGVIVGLLVIRFFLSLLGANDEHFFAQAIASITDPLLSPFLDPVLSERVSQFQFDFYILVAAVVYIVVSILISNLIVAFVNDQIMKVVLEIVDTVFKFFEFILLARLVLKIFGSGGDAPFVSGVYENTEWVAGLLPTVDILGGVLELSTLFILVAIIVVDLMTEGVVESFIKDQENKQQETTTTVQKTIVRERVVPQPAPVAQQPQNITINMPAQQPNQPPIAPRPVKRVINVKPDKTLPTPNQKK